MPFPVSETVELPTREGSDYLTRVYQDGGAFATLHDHYSPKRCDQESSSDPWSCG